jgi:hypothetical protein
MAANGPRIRHAYSAVGRDGGLLQEAPSAPLSLPVPVHHLRPAGEPRRALVTKGFPSSGSEKGRPGLSQERGSEGSATVLALQAPGHLNCGRRGGLIDHPHRCFHRSARASRAAKGRPATSTGKAMDRRPNPTGSVYLADPKLPAPTPFLP